MEGSSARSVQDTEELAYKLLASLPRSRLATIQRRIAPLLQFDVVGTLPTEVALQIFSYLPFQTLLTCGLVSKRWQALADDQSLWKTLCQARGWTWRHTPRTHNFNNAITPSSVDLRDSDDEGMGDSDEDEDMLDYVDSVEAAKAELTMMQAELDSGFASMSMSSFSPGSSSFFRNSQLPKRKISRLGPRRVSAPSILESLQETTIVKPDYKLLHQTHMKLRNRILSSSYRLSALQTRGGPTNAHTNTIYCLQLYTYPETGKQVLFTGSRDKSVREWNLTTGMVERVIADVHNSSILSLCVHNGYLASAGSDRQVAVWHLESNQLVKVLCDHEDSVLCVRFDDKRLVSCSKDRTVRTYSFPDLEFQFVLGAHRAAVNAVSISDSFIVSASGDRSVRLWDAETGKLLRTFDNHHTRGIASIDFCPPVVLSGSSDKHVRLFDITTLQGWSTSPEYDGVLPASNTALPFPFLAGSSAAAGLICQSCGSSNVGPASYSGPAGHRSGARCMHGDLVRTVALGEDFVLSGSYDLSIKIWDRKTGALVADLTGGHTGRIFCIGFDSKKIVSCGEDQRICVWDFSHGIDTSFLHRSFKKLTAEESFLFRPAAPHFKYIARKVMDAMASENSRNTHSIFEGVGYEVSMILSLPSSGMSFLRVDGTKLVNEEGNEVVLRGAGLGGWMTMENFISGYPGCEFQIREALAEAIGEQKAEFFFDKFLEHFFGEPDAEFFKSLGLNCIRIAVNYRHFEDDLNPRVLKQNAFKHLDRAIAVCAKHSIYTVIDMHTAPGGQSGGWHADAGSHIAYFWRHKDFQDRLIWIWEQIADHYKDNAWVAGYNVLNEPADPHPQHATLMSFYDHVYNAIRAIDKKHVLFLDGNTYATDFTKFPDDAGQKWDNTAYAIHDYAVFGFPSSPEPYEGTEAQIDRMKKTYQRKRAWMDEKGLFVWNGEWGPVYGREEYDGDETEAINKRRYKVLNDQLEIYKKDSLSWSIWLYKDIGFQGMVYVSRSTPYMQLFKDFLRKKQRLAVDAWGKDDRYVKHIYQPIVDLVKGSVADEANLKLYPPIWSVDERVTRISRTILVAEFMVKEWADAFRGLDEVQLEELASSFSFDNCVKREELNAVLRRHAPRSS